MESDGWRVAVKVRISRLQPIIFYEQILENIKSVVYFVLVTKMVNEKVDRRFLESKVENVLRSRDLNFFTFKSFASIKVLVKNECIFAQKFPIFGGDFHTHAASIFYQTFGASWYDIFFSFLCLFCANINKKIKKFKYAESTFSLAIWTDLLYMKLNFQSLF